MLLFLVTFARAVPVADKKRSLQLHSEDEEQDEEGARQQQRWQSRKPTRQRKLGPEV